MGLTDRKHVYFVKHLIYVSTNTTATSHRETVVLLLSKLQSNKSVNKWFENEVLKGLHGSTTK